MKATLEAKRRMLTTAVIGALLGLAACAPHAERMDYQTESASESQGIIGGDDVAASDPLVKSTVALGMVDGVGFVQVICTATLISKNMVVTAGHCSSATLDPRRLVIIFTRDLKAKNAAIRKVLGGRVPAKWPLTTDSQAKDWNDIAVLKFEGAAPAGYTPAVLLANKAALKDGMAVTIAGYGVIDMATEEMPDVLQKAAIKLTNSKFADSEILFAQADGKGACHGDSGGPAYVTVNGRAVLVGVTSRSATLAGGMTCKEGSIYTSVAAHIPFLKQAQTELNAKTFVAGEKIPRPRGF